MYNLFAFAIGARLVAFIVFVACVYAGNLLFAKLERRQTKFLWKITFVTLYSLFLLIVTYVVWFVFYFGLNAQMPCLCWGIFVWGYRDSRFTTRKFHPIYQDEMVFAFFKNDMTMEFSGLIIFMGVIVLLKNGVEA